MLEGIKTGVVGGDGGRVGVGVAAAIVEEDMGDGMQCVNHPYRNNPGGICAFCLQEKLGKLVSSSFPLPIRPSSSSASSPPSYRSETAVISAVRGGNDGGGGGVVTSSSSSSSLSVVRPGNGHYEECYTRKARIPFLLAKKKKKIMVASSSDHHHHHHHHHGGGNIAFKRSKSTTAPIRGRFLDGAVDNGGDFSPRKRSGFWSFLYLSSKTHSSKKLDKVSSSSASSIAQPPATTTVSITAAGGGGGGASSSSSGSSIVKHKEKSLVIIEDDDSSNNEATPSAASSSFERKVSRSRSVGCGSRSFSGDFFERISTGFGDCTLRRVESQREGKPKSSHSHSASAANVAASTMKERVKCGGIFGGFIITSSSSSSSSYWLSSSTEDHHHHLHHHHVNGRSTKSWGWAFASPMRAFTKPSSGKKDATTIIRESNTKNTTATATTTPPPNLAAIPSLLTVRV